MHAPEKQGEFLRRLRAQKRLTLQQVADLLAEHGYRVTRARISHFERGEPLGSAAQMAYIRAFGLEENLEARVRLQRLAGEAAGSPAAPSEAA